MQLRYLARTSTTPVIQGWKMQRYGYVPGLENVYEKVPPGGMEPEPIELLSPVTVS